MSYSTLLDDEGINQQYMAVLSPRRVAASFTLDSGSVYKQSFDYGHVSGVSVDGSSLTEAAFSSLNAGEFYYDYTNEILFVRTSGSDDPNNYTVVITYELYFATFDAHWHRVPTDSSTRDVYFEPVIINSPTIKTTTSDSLFGSLPVQSSNCSLGNAEHIFEKHIYDSSFNRAGFKLYHWLGDLLEENIKLVYDGYTARSARYSNQGVTLSTVDRIDIFSKEYRNSNQSFYNTSTFSDLDPNFQVAPIRYVYGVVDGFVPVNVSYVQENPTTSDNRSWGVIGEQANLNDVTATVAASPSSTTTRTYLNSAQCFLVGDSVWFDRVSGTDEYKIITAVDYASNYIEHEALVSAMVSGDSCKRAFVGNITVVQGENTYKPLYGRDYTTNAAMSGGVSGFTFTNNFEANHSGMATLSPSDRVFCRVYGRKRDLVLGGGAFGSNDSKTGNLTSPIAILIDLFVNKLGIAESSIDVPTFESLETSNTEAIGFAIPTSSRDSMPSYKDLVINILQTILGKLYVDNDNKWTLSKLAPIASTTKSVDDNEILKDSFNYNFNYDEILSDIVVQYDFKEASETLAAGSKTYSQVSATNTLASYLHDVNKQKTFKSLHFRESDAQTLANRLSYALGDRIGTASFDVKTRFYDTLINDKIEVSRKKLPGFEFDKDTERTRDVAVTSINKSLRVVQIETEDQKGIQDNSGSW